VRTCVGHLRNVHSFGRMVAAEPRERGSTMLVGKAFLGAGAASNWTIHNTYFKNFEPIADFMHVICYL